MHLFDVYVIKKMQLIVHLLNFVRRNTRVHDRNTRLK